jgi:hypothetical protein
MPIDEMTNRKIIDLYFNQRKSIREVCRIMGKSSHDVIPIIKTHRLHIVPKNIPDNEELAAQEKNRTGQKARVIPNVKAYKLFSEGKTPVEVSAKLNLPGPQVRQFYIEYWELRHMHKLSTIYQENKNSIGYSLRILKLARKDGLTPEQVVDLLKTANNIQDLQEKFQHLQKKIIDMEASEFSSKEQLRSLQEDMWSAKAHLSNVQEASKVKYAELMEICSQTQKLENYIKQFKNSHNYQEIEQIITDKVKGIIENEKRLLEHALVAVIKALRNDPDRYLLIDKMPVTTTILDNGRLDVIMENTFAQGYGPYVRKKVLELAGTILNSLQKNIVDSVISTVAGLDKESDVCQALPYYPTS